MLTPLIPRHLFLPRRHELPSRDLPQWKPEEGAWRRERPKGEEGRILVGKGLKQGMWWGEEREGTEVSRAQITMLPLNRRRGEFSFEMRLAGKRVDVGLAILTWPIRQSDFHKVGRHFEKSPSTETHSCWMSPPATEWGPPAGGGRVHRALHLPPLLHEHYCSHWLVGRVELGASLRHTSCTGEPQAKGMILALRSRGHLKLTRSYLTWEAKSEEILKEAWNLIWQNVASECASFQS